MMLREEVDNMLGESIQRIATNAFEKSRDLLVTKIKDYSSRGWEMYSFPGLLSDEEYNGCLDIDSHISDIVRYMLVDYFTKEGFRVAVHEYRGIHEITIYWGSLKEKKKHPWWKFWSATA